MLLRSILICLLLVAAGPAKPADAARDKNLPSSLYTQAKTYDPLAWMHGADRFPEGASIFLHDENGTHPLAPDFVASADPSVSFDGLRVLFAGKNHLQDPWQIWEMALDGGSPRRITAGKEDCIRPFYLPEERVVFACKTASRYVIDIADLEGGKPLALTYGPASFLPSDVLLDGRILFEAGYPLGTENTPEIYTVYSDGSGVESYRCDHGTARHSGKQNSTGDIIFASVDGLSRFTSARAEQIPVPVPRGQYAGDVVELASGDWLLSWRPEAGSPFRLVRWRPGARELEAVQTEAGANAVQPALIVPHAVPNRHPSGLHDWVNANLLCLNAYTSKYEFIPGSIQSARLYTRESDGSAKLLGTAPVERDGSFFVQVPTERPLQIELLDASGKALKRESGFFWMRRGEQRACVGCHAGPETAPENAVPQILLKSTTPADMTGATAPNASGGH